MSTTLTVSPSGTANLAAMSADIAKNARKPTVFGDGSIESPVLDSSTVGDKPPPQTIRPFTADALLDPDAASTGRFLDVTA
ncbi:hypothetical protein ABIE56_000319 [Luteibacter sp. 621]|uniref:hypothetical protein n=1 Tax=Luteibacter sp. 621 TaxID=3373916 RepID=UPI003D1C1FB9